MLASRFSPVAALKDAAGGSHICPPLGVRRSVGAWSLLCRVSDTDLSRYRGLHCQRRARFPAAREAMVLSPGNPLPLRVDRRANEAGEASLPRHVVVAEGPDFAETGQAGLVALRFYADRAGAACGCVPGQVRIQGWGGSGGLSERLPYSWSGWIQCVICGSETVVALAVVGAR